MQDEVNLNLAAEFWRAGVVRTDRLLRCDSIPGLRAAVSNAAPFEPVRGAANQPHPRRKFARQTLGKACSAVVEGMKSLVFIRAICKHAKAKTV